jgi:Retroviral aspartyl protease
MPAYDMNLFDPPAPLAKVTLRNQSSGATLPDVTMLIDSGADVTLIPRVKLSQLGVSVDPNQGYELMGFDGNLSVAQVVELDLVFLRRIFRGRFLIIDQEAGILGRDILNHLSLLLDGPTLIWNELRNPQA